MVCEEQDYVTYLYCEGRTKLGPFLALDASPPSYGDFLLELQKIGFSATFERYKFYVFLVCLIRLERERERESEFLGGVFPRLRETHKNE